MDNAEAGMQGDVRLRRLNPGFIARRLWLRSQCVFYRVVPGEQQTGSQPAGYRFGLVARERVEQDPVFAVKGRAERFRTRFDSPHRCYGFHSSSGEVVAVFWLSLAWDQSIEVPFRYGLSLRLAPGQAYIWDCATGSPHQNRGLYRAGLALAAAEARAQGARDVFVVTDVDNQPSMRGISAAGFHELGRLTLTQAGPLRIIRPDAGETRTYWRAQAIDLRALSDAFVQPARRA